MSVKPDLRVISLGAGVQSTTMALMATHGAITPMPDAAIFADTGSEPKRVYEHLRWLCSNNVLPFPVYQVSAGSLTNEILDASKGRNRNWGRPPLYVRNPDGSRGILRRQCTGDFKVIPIERQIRELLGLKKGQRWPVTPVVEQWIGFSLDEVVRMKPSRRPAIEWRFPLIEKEMTRWDCYNWLERHDYPVVRPHEADPENGIWPWPPSSACVYCPFRNDESWRLIRSDPDDWAQAIEVDSAVRSQPYRSLTGAEAYLHHSLVPLPDVDLRTAAEKGQPDLFGDECEGACGV